MKNLLLNSAAALLFGLASMFAFAPGANAQSDELIHFFFFQDLPNNTPLESIDAVFSVNATGAIEFESALEGYPFDEDHPDWRRASMERRGEQTPLNYRPEGNGGIEYDDAGNIRAMQIKQPFTDNGRENTLFFKMSTAGFEDVVLTFAAMDEDAGGQNLLIDYSVTSGEPEWITTGLDAGETTQPLETDTYQLYTVDFTGIEEADNNPSFIVRIRFDVEDGTADSGDRITFNNIALDGAPFSGLTTYFYDGTGDLTDTASWGRNADGSGDAPANFSADSQIFVISNTATSTLSTNWEVSGSGSKVVVGDGTTFILQAELDSLLDVESGGTLRLEHGNQPELGILDSGSTVVFAGDAVDIPYTGFGNLTFDNIDPVFDGDGMITVSGNMTLEGSVSMPAARDENEYDFTFTGTGDQVLSSNGNVFRSYETIIIKTEGSFELDADNGGTILSTDNQITFNVSEDASFADNGQTIYAGNSVNIAGDGDAYNYTGTLILAGTEDGIVNGSGDDNNFNIREDGNDNIVAELNNIIVRVENTDGQFRFRDGTTDVFTIKGDFIVESGADGRIRFYDNEVFVGGDFIIEDGFAGSLDDVVRLVFNGEGDQLIDSALDLEAEIFEVDKAGGTLEIMNGSTVLVEEELVLTSGSALNNGNLVMMSSDFDETARVSESGTGTLAGNITIERWLDSDADPGAGTYFGLGSAVTASFTGGSDAGMFSNVWTQGAEGGNTTGGDANVWSYDESFARTEQSDPDGWEAVSNYNSDMALSTGYLAFIYTDDQIGQDGSWPKVLGVTGPFNAYENDQSEVQFPVTFTDNEVGGIQLGGLNFLANPFISDIDWDHGAWTRTNIDDTFWVIENDGSISAYTTGSGGTGVAEDGRLASGQAFFVQANASSPVMSVTSEAKTTGASFMNADDHYEIRVQLQGSQYSGETLISLRDGFEVPGAKFLPPVSDKYSIIYTANENANMLINGVGLSTLDEAEELTFPIYTATTSGGTHSLNISQAILPEGVTAVITDAETGETYDIEEELEISFTATESNASNPEQRFSLKLTAGEPTSVATGEAPAEFALKQNYPNPFNPVTQIRYDLPESADVRLEVFNVQGQRVAVLVNSTQNAGAHTVSFNAQNLSSGVYLYRLQAGEFQQIRKMTLIK